MSRRGRLADRREPEAGRGKGAEPSAGRPGRYDPRHQPDPYQRLRDPEVQRRYRSCLLSLLFLSGALPFLAISLLVIRTVGHYARQRPLDSSERILVIAAQVVFLWSLMAIVWGLRLAWRYLQARRAGSRSKER